MKMFNAFQITVVFAAWPFLVQFLSSASFPGVEILLYGACACYVFMFSSIACAVSIAIDKDLS